MIDPQTLSEELSPLQLQAIKALLTERNQTAAAAKVGVSRVTIWRWFKKPVFKQAVIAGKREQVEALRTEMRQSQA